ncbi:Na+/H+ antiporter subunit E [Nocardia sp.]
MTRERMVRVGVLLWLALVYTALWGNMSAANVLAGLAIGTIIMIALPLPKMPVKGRFAPWAIVQASVIGIAYAIESSMQIAWFAVRPGPPPVSGVLRVGLSTRSDLVLVLTTDLLNLIPGTMVLEIDRHRCLVYVHVLDVGSEKAVEKFYRQTRTLERLLITAFERPVPKHPLRAKK